MDFALLFIQSHGPESAHNCFCCVKYVIQAVAGGEDDEIVAVKRKANDLAATLALH